MKKKNALTQEFIGKNIEILETNCISLKGLHGKIIDETKNAFAVETIKGIKRIIKNKIVFRVDDQDYIINGKEISKRPEERLKMRIENE